MTRALQHLLRAEVLQALQMHPMLPAVLALALYYGVYRYLLGRPAPHWNGFLWATVIAMLACYALRMVLLFPHTAPMTYQSDNLLAYVLSRLGILGS